MMFDGKVKGMRNVNLSGKKTKIEQNNNKAFLENARIQRELRAIERLKYTSAIRIQAKYRGYIVCKKLYIHVCYQFDQHIIECTSYIQHNFNIIDDADQSVIIADDDMALIINDNRDNNIDNDRTVSIQNKIMKLIQLIIILYKLKHQNSSRLIQLNRLILSITDKMDIIASTPSSYDLSYSIYHSSNRRIFMMMNIYRYNLNALMDLFLSSSPSSSSSSSSSSISSSSSSSSSIRSDDINVILSFLSLFIDISTPPAVTTTNASFYSGINNDNNSSNSSSSSSSSSSNDVNGGRSRSIVIYNGLNASVRLLISFNQLSFICLILRSMILFKYSRSSSADQRSSYVNGYTIDGLTQLSSSLSSSLDRFMSMLIQILHNSISFKSISSSIIKSSSAHKQYDFKNYRQVSINCYILYV